MIEEQAYKLIGKTLPDLYVIKARNERINTWRSKQAGKDDKLELEKLRMDIAYSELMPIFCQGKITSEIISKRIQTVLGLRKVHGMENLQHND
ncbi:MAG: hypothetical protein KGI54_13025 [Pseudomonadota bacterium]|nr:hypothetical protein [Pseudomonadota bacterium]